MCALAVGSYTWRRLTSLPERLASSIILGAVVVGGAGFVGGFFGPLIFAPEASESPLLGLFITDPLGARDGRTILRRGR